MNENRSDLEALLLVMGLFTGFSLLRQTDIPLFGSACI